jgi:hypothetical protein
MILQYKKLIFLSFVIPLLFSACKTQTFTKIEAFPKMYEERPLSILVLPLYCETTETDAREYCSITLSQRLTLEGYYVYPVEVACDIIKNEGLYDQDLLLSTPPQKYKELFGTDAVLYLKILKWDNKGLIGVVVIAAYRSVI